MSLRICCLLTLLFTALAGCKQDPNAASAQAAPFAQQQQQLAMAPPQAEWQTRASSLDSNNQELQAQLAQAQQQNRLLQDQMTVTREQLNSVSQQLADARESQNTTQQRALALAASMQKRGGATITANSSLTRNLPAMNIPGVEVRQDGDVVRVELPTDRLFNQGTAQLRQDAVSLLDASAAELVRAYPNQIIGIEGHTDNDAPQQGVWFSNHQLSTARATAVFDYLVTRAKMRPQQLFLVGHGGNHPVVSNASTQGKARNRRIELVVYPEQWQR